MLTITAHHEAHEVWKHATMVETSPEDRSYNGFNVQEMTVPVKSCTSASGCEAALAAVALRRRLMSSSEAALSLRKSGSSPSPSEKSTSMSSYTRNTAVVLCKLHGHTVLLQERAPMHSAGWIVAKQEQLLHLDSASLQEACIQNLHAQEVHLMS